MKVHTLKEIKRIADTGQPSTVEAGGWIKTIRKSKHVGFIEITDGTILASTQIVIEGKTEAFKLLDILTAGSCIQVTGTLVTGLKGKQNYEILAQDITIHGIAKDYPLQKKEQGYEFLRTLPSLRARTQTFNAVFRLRSILTDGLLEYLRLHDFIRIQTPTLTTTDGEGAGDVFQVQTDDETPFFNTDTYLTVTGQLHLEPFIGSYRNIFTFGPSYRAEKSHTSRHVAEFWQLEPEMAFVDLNDLIDTIESLTKYGIQYCLDNASEELKFLDSTIEEGLIKKLEDSLASPYQRISYTQAIQDCMSSFPDLTWEEGLQSEHERYLTDVVYQKPVFVTDYPIEQKAFYMRLNDDGKTVGATDLLFPKIGEIVGASVREERYDMLEKQLHTHGLDIKEYQWYLDTRKYGTVPHGGFGIGIERLMRYISGMDNIRDVIAYPRTPGSIRF